jgi:hypothetical protein
MHGTRLLGATLVAAGVLAGTAGASMMHPALTARLSGMGEHGSVNLQSNAKSGKLCWTFDVMTHGITGASIRDSGGMVVAKLGPGYTAKSCAAVSTKALAMIESKPGSYMVWVDTKGHMGELRGTLTAGMTHM